MRKLLSYLMFFCLLLTPLSGLAVPPEKCEHPLAFECFEFTDEDQVTYTPIDIHDHLKEGKGITYMYCPDCGTRFDESKEKNLKERFSHSFDSKTDGKCIYCGYVNTCKHENSDEYAAFFLDGTTFTSIDNVYHLAEGQANVHVFCEDCGVELEPERSEYRSEQQRHSYDSDNKCSLCGHVNDCKHVNLNSWYSFSEEATYTSVDNRNHTVKGPAFFITYCQDCEQTISREKVDEYSDVRNHDYDENQKCRDCGHVNDCKHENTSSWMSFGEDVTYTSVDNRTHTVKGKAEQITYCDDCGQTLSMESLGEATEEQGHNYDENQKCRDCGHVNDCKHETTSSGRSFDWDKSTYTSVDNRSHIAKGSGYIDYWCDDCGQKVRSEPFKDYSEKQDHWYDSNGKCGACGHVNTCTHEHKLTDSWFSNDERTYTQLNARFHLAAGKGQVREYCADCGQELSWKDVASRTERQSHSFSKDGVCTQCGFSNVCQHDGQKYTSFSWDGTPVCKDDGNGQTHTYTGSGKARVVCSKCGSVLSEKAVASHTSRESHWYNDQGVCYECGAARGEECQHENVSVSTYIETNEGATFAAKDAKYHTVTGRVYQYTICDDCGRWISGGLTGETATEDVQHSFLNGVCMDCGYTSACAHEHSHTYRWMSFTESISDINEHGHTLHGDLSVYTWCDDCGDTISGQIREKQALQEPHNLQNGICTICGYQATCTHANKVTKTGIANSARAVYTPVDEKTHSATGEIYYYDECADCGQTFYIDRAHETGTVVEEHTFVGGKCIDCGYGTDTFSVEPFVARCYKIILGRDADEGGLAGWATALANGASAASNIIDGFVRSDEFTNKNLSNEQIVDVLYQAMMGREADAAGKAAWAEVLNQGNSLGAVINGFCGSAEFTALCNQYGIQAGSVDVAPPATGARAKIEAFVKRCYQLILNREADQGGLQGWSDALETGAGQACQIIDGFVRSPEYVNRNLGNAESVDILYQTMLNRAADEGGKAGWVDALEKGYTLQHIINGFCGSAEFTSICNEYGITAGNLLVQGVLVKREAIAPEGEEEAPVVYVNYSSEYTNEEKIRAFVEHCYEAVFGREGDAEGIEAYTKLILEGKKTPKRVAYEIIFSAEFQNNLPGNEAFIRILYRLYFNRDADPEGLAGWIAMLENGASLEEIVNGFATSEEFKAIVNEMKS